jgi:hypothetical protein
MLRLNSAAHGWTYDRLSDLARVLRIPGTINHKDPANPKDVTVLSSTDHRYNLSDFEEFLDGAGIPDPEAEEQATREWAERFADKPPLVINVNARIPQETLDGWMAADMRFRNTWLRQRHDLKDQSQSGYDMALAAFGAQAGLTEQQIVEPDRPPPQPVRKVAAHSRGLLPKDHSQGLSAQFGHGRIRSSSCRTGTRRHDRQPRAPGRAGRTAGGRCGEWCQSRSGDRQGSPV